MLETKDLVLHQGSPEDADDLYRNLWSRGEVFACLFSSPSPDPEAGRQRTMAYAQMHRTNPTEFFIYQRSTGRPIGIAGIKELAPGRWTVTDLALGPAYQGRGYGRQALLALVELAFVRCGARTLAYSCFAENAASKELAISCGFLFSHCEQAEKQKNGRPVTLEVYALQAPKRQSGVNVCAIVRRGGKLLLVKRQSGPYKGQWDLPGGGLRPGEDHWEALDRTLLAECGLPVKTAKLAEVRSRREMYRNEENRLEDLCLVSLVYEAALADGKPQGNAGAHWLSPERLETLPLTPNAQYAAEMVYYEIVPYEDKYRDDMIYVVLEAKNALGRLPRLNEDLLDIQSRYLDRGDGFWLAVDEQDRVVGCMGYNIKEDGSEAVLHRLYVKSSLKRRGIGSALLERVEEELLEKGVERALVHLGGKEYFESHKFYPKHGYKPWGESWMRKKLKYNYVN